MNRITIVKSPTKWDLISSLADGKKIILNTSSGLLSVKITELQQEDGSGQSWLLKGYIIQEANNLPFRGYVRTNKDSGFLDLVDSH